MAVGIVVEAPNGKKFLVEAVMPKVVSCELKDALDFWLDKEKSSCDYVVCRHLEVSRSSHSMPRGAS